MLTTVNAVLQRVPPRDLRAPEHAADGARPARRLAASSSQRLSLAGYTRTGTVMEPGEYAVRGSMLDLFPPGRTSPVRLDFFGDTLESIKSFDPETQRTTRIVQKLALMPVTELAFGDGADSLFRQRYVAAFGAVDRRGSAVRGGQRRPALPGHGALAAALPRAPGNAVRLRAGRRAELRSSGRRGRPPPLRAVTEHYEARMQRAGDGELRRAALQAGSARAHVHPRGRAWKAAAASAPVRCA